MSNTSPPIEAQRFGRSQTPESPRPVHLPEPSNNPILLNQMDPVFNDTNTYNIPSNQTFSPYGDSLESAGYHNSTIEEQDAVQSFFREAENQATAEPVVKPSHSELHPAPDVPNGAQQLFSNSTMNEGAVAQNDVVNVSLQPNYNTETRNLDFANNNSQAQNYDHAMSSQVGAFGDESGKPSQTLQTGEVVNNRAEYSDPPNTYEAEGDDTQSVLDKMTQSSSIVPAYTALTTTSTVPASVEQSSHSLPLFPGLPPKPPPQEHPVEYSNFTSDSQSQPYHSFPSTAALEHQQSQNLSGPAENSISTNQNSAAPIISSNDHVSIPFSLSVYESGVPTRTANDYLPLQNLQTGSVYSEPPRSQDGSDRPWTPKTQSLYDQFLEDERGYVTEGVWDRFPVGSRLFVGNLPSEKVTKRDLFHTFHRHGRLAQISIKQAYGFVQYHDAASCLAALNNEQGVEIRGRKVHLEISKPQKNTRNAGGNSGNKVQVRRRSRSPDRGVRRGDRSGVSEFREDSSRRRDEYRSRRSPSPRRYGSRDNYRTGDSNRDDRRSPMYAANYGVPPPPPPPSTFDDEASLPIPRRDPRNVPDVQLIILEQGLAQSFINWVEQGFRSKGLQASTVWLNQRLPLAGVIKRQIIEGVQAVVKLSVATQNTSKIPLQVFDRTAGASNVNFSEYADLDVAIAADIVIRARQNERAPMHAPRPAFPPAQGFPHSSYGPPMPPGPYPPPAPPQYSPQPPHTHQQNYQYPQQPQANYRPLPHGPPTPSGQPPNLQELLANLKGNNNTNNHNNPPTPQSAHSANSGHPTDLAGLLSGVARQQNPGQQHQPQYGQSAQYPSYGSVPPPQNGYVGVAQTSSQSNGGSQQNVQNIMDQLARFQR